MSASARLIRVWEAAQVELRCRYSLTRFHEILHHAKQTSRWQHIGIMLLTPLPALVLIVFLDVLPLYPPEDGFYHQSLGFYLRILVTGWLMAHMILMQTHQSAPTLPLSTARHWAISLTTGLLAFLSLAWASSLIGFPTPFAVHLSFGPWLTTFVTTVWLTWKDALAANPDAKRKVFHYGLIVFNAQSAMFFVYSCYTVTFNRIPATYQMWFTFLLPLIKLGFKNWVIKGLVYMEDLVPTIVVFNVDVFHAVFVSSTMQSSSSWGSVAVVMAVDFAQAVVAFSEVAKVFRRINALAVKSLNTSDSRTQSRIKLKLGVIDFALDLIDSNPRIREHQDVALPRYRRVSQLQSAHLVPVAVKAVRTEKTVDRSSTPQQPLGPQIVPMKSATVQEELPLSCQLDAIETTELACVKGVLKMLHMIEFYVLIEFAEAIVPMINAVYLHIMVYLPNRVYYWSLASLTQEELQAKANRMAIYASLELLSFVVFCCMMDRKLRHTSTYQILAFVLRKHTRISLTTLTMWIYFIVQLGVRHVGVDYTFEFKWLHKQP